MLILARPGQACGVDAPLLPPLPACGSPGPTAKAFEQGRRLLLPHRASPG